MTNLKNTINKHDKILHITDNDLDGYSCALIDNLFNINADIKVIPSQEMKEGLPINVKDNIVVLTDVSTPIDNDDLYIFDHHITFKSESNKHVIDTNRCGSKIWLDYVIDVTNGYIDNSQNAIAGYIRGYIDCVDAADRFIKTNPVAFRFGRTLAYVLANCKKEILNYVSSDYTLTNTDFILMLYKEYCRIIKGFMDAYMSECSPSLVKDVIYSLGYINNTIVVGPNEIYNILTKVEEAEMMLFCSNSLRPEIERFLTKGLKHLEKTILDIKGYSLTNKYEDLCYWEAEIEYVVDRISNKKPEIIDLGNGKYMEILPAFDGSFSDVAPELRKRRNTEGYNIHANLLMDIRDTLIVFSMRSDEEVNVGDIAKFNGGGGHMQAAGFTIDAKKLSIKLPENENELIKIAHDVLDNIILKM